MRVGKEAGTPKSERWGRAGMLLAKMAVLAVVIGLAAVVAYGFGTRSHVLVGPPPQTASKSVETATVSGLPLKLEQGDRAQELRNRNDALAQVAVPGSVRHDWGFASNVEIVWSGDLNGDAELDLLLKQGDAETGSSVELFLSTGGSTPSKLVLVDKFDYGGC
jgi:hypothetical protein